MSNIYRTHFVSRCPNNRQMISYAFEIDVDEMIHVEHITTAIAMHESGYHEAIADALFERFGGRQILKAHHHGVDIETRRGFELAPCGRLTERVQIGSTIYEKGVEAIHAIRAVSR